jgi:AraC-like DNA-binding protein
MANTEQYLASIIKTQHSEQNELLVASPNRQLSLLKLYLENHNRGVHRYQDNFTIITVLAGTVLIKFKEQSLILKAGNIVLLAADCRYQLLKQDADAIVAKLKFGQLDLKELCQQLGAKTAEEERLIKQITTSYQANGYLFLKTSPVMRSAQLVLAIIDEYLNANSFSNSLIASLLVQFMVLSLRQGRFSSQRNLSRAQFAGSSLDQYIDAHFTDISLKAAAEHFGFNSNYFSNLVKKETGKSFIDHVDQRRMQEARQLLAEPDMSLKEIIKRVGFSSKSFFYKKFNQYYGMTPAKMRQELFRQANINLK